MKIAVCLKQILDPEVPARDFKVDAAKREAEQGGANLVTNIFCENALETALQIRDAAGSGEIVAISVGPAGAEILGHMAAVADPARRLVVTGGWAAGPAAQAVKARHLGAFELSPALFSGGARGAAIAAARAATFSGVS